MTARDAISPLTVRREGTAPRSVESDMPLVDVLPRLLDSPGHMLEVLDGATSVGSIDESSMLAALGAMLAPRDDCSLLTVTCRPQDYCASTLAHAVEDTGSHLVDLWSAPAEDGMLRVTLRVRCSDPSQAVRSLERYDFNVTEAHGSEYTDRTIARDRMLALQAYLNV